MSEKLSALAHVPWHWEWVPEVQPDAADDDPWTARMVELFTEWTAEGLASARQSWPAEAEAEFPLTGEAVGHGVAGWLRERAAQLPAWSRLAWGAAFLDGEPRWAPVPVVVEFRRPDAEDPNYLLELMGAGGVEGDTRPPAVDYVTTLSGDGFRLFALGRTSDGAAYGRVGAALRLDVPQGGDTADIGVDVLMTTLVFEMGLMGVIGSGMEQLMQQIAEESVAPPGGGQARLGFFAPQGEVQS
ncbi:hypothetical protein [Streptomyces pinistramenti]|uniref:hypothetical protein n=1 Tax=Streptomyces pinistramenti TaxID=2884812 RepID=UPI001D07B1CA|nr:hypothetical protein [Streptomyces pinistramenti]MCB5907525.1 hypothetical protein [Streptomyces pinistramenti]